MTVIILEATGSHMQQVHFIQAWHKPFTFSSVSLSQIQHHRRSSYIRGSGTLMLMGYL